MDRAAFLASKEAKLAERRRLARQRENAKMRRVNAERAAEKAKNLAAMTLAEKEAYIKAKADKDLARGKKSAEGRVRNKAAKLAALQTAEEQEAWGQALAAPFYLVAIPPLRRRPSGAWTQREDGANLSSKSRQSWN